MKLLLLPAALLFAPAAFAQTVPLDPSAPVRGGSEGQTTVAPLNPALNQSTIQGPPEVQRTLTNRDAQPSRLPTNNAGIAVPGATPEQSPTAQPDVREQPVHPVNRRRQDNKAVLSRNPHAGQTGSTDPQPAPQPASPQP